MEIADKQADEADLRDLASRFPHTGVVRELTGHFAHGGGAVAGV
jgi:hypothetical protein